MVAYREIVSTSADRQHVINMLQDMKVKSEVIIIPLEDDTSPLINLQYASMSTAWDNDDDKAWDEL
jgi:flagellar biosynthesis regulator FlbT